MPDQYKIMHLKSIVRLCSLYENKEDAFNALRVINRVLELKQNVDRELKSGFHYLYNRVKMRAKEIGRTPSLLTLKSMSLEAFVQKEPPFVKPKDLLCAARGELTYRQRMKRYVTDS